MEVPSEKTERDAGKHPPKDDMLAFASGFLLSFCMVDHPQVGWKSNRGGVVGFSALGSGAPNHCSRGPFQAVSIFGIF